MIWKRSPCEIQTKEENLDSQEDRGTQDMKVSLEQALFIQERL